MMGFRRRSESRNASTVRPDVARKPSPPELLEGRAVLSSFSLTQFPGAPAAAIGPMANGPDGKVWFSEVGGSGTAPSLGRVSTSGQFDSVSLPADVAHVNDLTAGPDGNMWFAGDRGGTAPGSAILGKVSPSGAVTEIPVPNALTVEKLASGHNGEVFFAAETDAQAPTSEIGRIDANGQMTIVPVGRSIEQVTGLAVDALDDLWIAQAGNPGEIDRVAPTGPVQVFAIPVARTLTAKQKGGPATFYFHATSLTAGPDGNIWIAEGAGDNKTYPEIVRVTPYGVFHSFPVTGVTSATGKSADPAQIVSGIGKDHSVYVSFRDINQAGAQPQNVLGRVHTGTGQISLIHLPAAQGGSPGDSADGPLTVGSDGQVYFLNENLPGGPPKVERLNAPAPLKANM